MPEVRLITPITRQSTKKMQVAAYCRVSSNSADQLNSYAAQIRAYKKCIGARDDWELVDIFADEGLTGMKSETRDEFQRMIRMCELKQIDLIITKSISRFARNTKDALAYVRKLKLLGVGVQFEKEGISTLSMGDEMLLNTFSALAQEESQSISMNQRLSIVKRMELGEYVDSNAPYGYRLVDNQQVRCSSHPTSSKKHRKLRFSMLFCCKKAEKGVGQNVGQLPDPHPDPHAEMRGKGERASERKLLLSLRYFCVFFLLTSLAP